MRSYRFIHVFFLLFLLAENVCAAQPPPLETREVRIFFENGIRPAAEETADIFPLVKKDLEHKLGWTVNFKPTVLLMKEGAAFRKWVDTDLIVAAAFPQKNLIVIDYSRMKTHPFTIDITLKHELCHLLLHHVIGSRNLPRWLDEGIAQWVSGGFSELITNTKSNMLPGAVLSGRMIDIRNLAGGFPTDRQSLFLAYEESKSFVEYLISEFGIAGLRSLLENLREGFAWPEAMERSFSMSLDDCLRAWRSQLEKRITWFIYLSHHLYEVLFFIAALVMIYGFIKAYKKKRAYIDDAGPADLE
ncbi:MAG: peptidase MA family metallohydrolase [Pseudomonadota bacterium]